MEIVNLPAVIPQPEAKTLDGLIAAYTSDPFSPFHKNRFVTRRHDMTLMRRVSRDHGAELIRNINGRKVIEWHQTWVGPEDKIPMAHALIGTMRTLVGYGVTMLEWEECRNLKMVLSGLRFPNCKPRGSILTTPQVIAICRLAHEMGHHSLALAQTIQHGGILRQKDVLGEWVPASEPVKGIVEHDGKKWLRGIHWGEVSRDLILSHITSKKGKPVELDLKRAPMIMMEIGRLSDAQILRGGPIIVCEQTGLPYQAQHFRKLWRAIADKAGVPNNVRNMDTRAGAITEALKLGIRPQAVKNGAQHTELSTTQIYARGQFDDQNEVLTRRGQEHAELLAAS